MAASRGIASRFADLAVRIVTASIISVAQIALLYAGSVYVQAELAIVGAIGFHEFITVPWATKKDPGHEPYPALSRIAQFVPYGIYVCVVLIVIPLFAGLVNVFYPLTALLVLIAVFTFGLDRADLKTGMLRMGLTGVASFIPLAVRSATTLLEVGGMQWFVECALLMAINDMGGYFCGRIFGKHLLTPLSPKKTWEGFIGALVVTMIAGAALPDRPHTLALAAFNSLIAPVAGVLGSAFKRAFGVKDYGWIVIGHGGVLDRIDCQLFAVVFAAAYVQAFVAVRP